MTRLMRRIKLVLAMVSIMVVMLLVAAPPAVANHEPDVWEWSPWGNLWCLTQWEQRHDESWDIEFSGCVNANGEWVVFED